MRNTNEGGTAMTITRRVAALLLASAAFYRPFASRAAGEAQTPPAPAPAPDAGPAALPKDIVWITDNDQPLIGSEKAIRGGTLNTAIDAYPLTFRLMGPNSNDGFAAWNRAFTMAFGLVAMHPVTDQFIPVMATHWSIQPDQKTLYFKLDPDARWSDGKPITADDFVFTWKMMQSKDIVDPFYNTYAMQYYQSVDKIDDYTLRIVGTRPSWRPLVDFAGLWPTPAHATQLDKDWVTRTNNQYQVAVGPYIVSDADRGVSVTFKRLPEWWGDKKRYFIGLYNFDEIKIKIIDPDRELDYLRLGELDIHLEGTARTWNEGYAFPAVTNGWIRRARVFLDMPSGVSGLHMNLEAPIFQNRDFRLAMQYLFNFERINRNLMYSEYFRKNSFFDGTEFANPDVKAYPFDPVKAAEHLARAGYRRPASVAAESVWAKLRNAAYDLVFTRSDTDDILVNERGEKASFTLIYGVKAFEPHLTVIQQDYRRAGVDMKLQQLEPGTTFERGLERKFEMIQIGWSAGFYPDPREYLGTQFKNSNNNNDVWGFGTKEVDGLIDIYEQSLDAEARKRAMYKIDQIVHDEAFYIPFWDAPYVRLAYWDYLQFPEFYLPKRTQSLTDYLVEWIDPEKKAALAEAMKAGKAYPVDQDIDKDYYGVRKKYQ
jgi:microcin C transport system substrate-binding protein